MTTGNVLATHATAPMLHRHPNTILLPLSLVCLLISCLFPASAPAEPPRSPDTPARNPTEKSTPPPSTTAPHTQPEPTPDQTPQKKSFVVLDGMLFLKKPNLEAAYGLKPVISAGREFWALRGPLKKPDTTEPDEKHVRYYARAAARRKTYLIYIDIEHWPTTGNDTDVAQSVRKYVRIADWIHAEEPSMRIGFYGVPPNRDYWNAIQGENSPRYIAWQTGNKKLAQIARHADVLFPSLYTFYDDQSGWKKYALANLREADAYGKLTYAFLWPQYHDSNKQLSCQFLPPDYWRMELETCYEHADGVVIWGGWMDQNGRRCVWDDQAPWWLETLRFLKDIGPGTASNQAPSKAPSND